MSFFLMRSQMMRVISSPSSSTTGLATLILSMSFPRKLWREPVYVATFARPNNLSGDSPSKAHNDRPCRHPVPSPIGGKYRRRRPGDEEFRADGVAAGGAQMPLAERAGGGPGCRRRRHSG